MAPDSCLSSSSLPVQDADYQQWYDEAANPLAQCSRPASGDLDAAFDAAFGGGPGAAGLLRLPPLPRDLLEASSVAPWQAAVTASLKLLTQCLKLAGGLNDSAAALAALQTLAWRLASVAQRNTAVQAVLRLVRAGCSRTQWLAADRDAAAAAAGGALLHCMAALHELLTLRTLRRTIPPLLDAHASLIDCLLPAARVEAATLAGAAPSRQRQLQPLALAASTARVLLLHPQLSPPPPPQLNVKLNPAALTGTAAAALLRLAGEDQDGSIQAAGLLWALLAADAAPRGEGAPAWVHDQLDLDVSRLVLLEAGAEARAAAVAELLLQLAQGLATLQARLGEADTELRLHELLPAMDACSVAMARALAEQRWRELEEARVADEHGEQQAGERRRRRHHPPEWGDTELMGGVALKRLAAAAAQLCDLCALGAERLASLLDASGRSGPSGGEVPALAELLALGVELGSALARVLEAGAIPMRQRQALVAAAERLEGAQQACLELLRGLPEAHPGYAAATAAMDSAPSLWLASTFEEDAQLGSDGCSSSGEEEMQQQQQQQRREGSSRWRRRMKDIRNPYLRAILAEGDAGGLCRASCAHKPACSVPPPPHKHTHTCGLLTVLRSHHALLPGEIDAEDLSDLEDFIVVNPKRDYGSFIACHFPQTAAEEDEEEGRGEAGGSASGDGGNSDAERE